MINKKNYKKTVIENSKCIEIIVYPDTINAVLRKRKQA